MLRDRTLLARVAVAADRRSARTIPGAQSATDLGPWRLVIGGYKSAIPDVDHFRDRSRTARETGMETSTYGYAVVPDSVADRSIRLCA
jgi:hypothetical protein